MPTSWWEFPKIGGGGTVKGFLKGIYKISIVGLGFRVSENQGVPFLGSPYNKDPTI